MAHLDDHDCIHRTPDTGFSVLLFESRDPSRNRSVFLGLGLPLAGHEFTSERSGKADSSSGKLE